MRILLLIGLLPFIPFLRAQPFTEVADTPFEGVLDSSVAFSDVDGDGDYDVFIMGQDSSEQRIEKLYRNDGMGGFTEVTGNSFESGSYASLAFSDIDGDGDNDVLMTGLTKWLDAITNLYLNDGTGNYTEVEDHPFESVAYSAIAFSDVDSDGDSDVLITGSKDVFVDIATLYLNDGAGGYSEAVDTPFEPVTGSSVAFSDVDGDGDSDVLIIGRNDDDRIAKLYTNDGTGGYTEVTGTPFEYVRESTVAFSDVDGDGDSDVLIMGEQGSYDLVLKLYTNDGAGGFAEVADTPFEPVEYGTFVFSDVDGDGDSDLLITGDNSSWERIAKLYTNDGSGNFTEVMGTPFDAVRYGSVAFADIDGDGDKDLLITGQNSSKEPIAKLYINNFSPSKVPGVQHTTIKIYPNPTTGLVHWYGTTVERVEIYNLYGQRLRELAWPGRQIELTGLPAGVYFLLVKDMNGARYSARVAKR